MTTKSPPHHLPIRARLIESTLRTYSRIAPASMGSFRLIRQARRLIPRSMWRRVFQTPAGHALELDLSTYPDCCMAYGLYERETERVIRRLLRPGDHFVDAGANIGYFTLLAAGLVGPTGRVDAFEPQPDNRARLLENLARNGSPSHVHVHPVALADRAGEAEIHMYPADHPYHNHGSSTLTPEPGVQTRAVRVPTVRMDDALPENAMPELVKMDVEGAEPLVIGGMTKLITRCQPAIIMEWSGAAGSPERVDRLLAASPAYRVNVIGARLRRIEPTAANLRSLRQLNLLFTVD